MIVDTTKNALLHPDHFAADLHTCLLCDGIRSSAVRRLRRIAWGKAELERIFETKVSEFRRFNRESRVPSVANLPARGWEWICEHARFTPLQEVGWTAMGVLLALVCFEFAKAFLVSPSPIPEWLAHQQRAETMIPIPAEKQEDDITKVDQWFVKNLKTAVQSTAFRATLRQVLHDEGGVDHQNTDLRQRIAAEEFKTGFLAQFMQVFDAGEVNDSYVRPLTSTETADWRSAIEKAIRNRLHNPEFEQQLYELLVPSVKTDPDSIIQSDPES